MKSEYFAIAHTRDLKNVSLLCQPRGKDDRGRHFDVVNGAWGGYITESGDIYTTDFRTDEKLGEGKIVWEGKLEYFGRDYNEAIHKIESML